MLNRQQKFIAPALNDYPRTYAPEVRYAGYDPENGMKMARDGFQTLDRANPLAWNQNRRGVAPPALQDGPRSDWDDHIYTTFTDY